MDTITRLAELRSRIAVWRRVGERIALVPTMGNLHAGHLDLVRRARQRADRTVATIFVNPLQFGPGEDLAAYPRTLEADRKQLEQAGCDLLFAPKVEEVYPGGQALQTRVEVPGISDILCGASRPGHFTGVATVVCKLFNMVQPDLAVFGEKDFQQLLVIRRMNTELSMPVEIVGAPTVREPDGLAMSSRNAYLTPEQRGQATCLVAGLRAAWERFDAGARDAATLVAAAREVIEAQPAARVDYVELRDAETLEPAETVETVGGPAVLALAVFFGKTRLIDNTVLGGERRP